MALADPFVPVAIVCDHIKSQDAQAEQTPAITALCAKV